MDESYITPEIQARVGVASEPVTVDVTPEIVRRLRETLGIGTGDQVPPAVLWVPDAGREVSPLPGLPGEGILTGDEWELRRAIRLGERLTAVNRLVDLNERFGSRLGHALTVRHEWEFRDAAGEAIAFARRSIAYYRQEDMPRRDEAEAYGPPPPPAPPLEPAEGAGPRVAQPGDAITSMLVTPTLEQVVRYIAVTWNVTTIFFDPDAAKAAGLPGTIIPGPLKLGLLAEMVLSWAGPGTLLESIRAAFRRPDTPGRPLLLGGSVVSAADTGNGRRLQCDLWMQNADGERSVMGAASVHLPDGA
jgi:acyl dehydratase